MNAGEECVKKKEKSHKEKLTVSMEDTNKSENIDLADPKPRIVLTIRSEKSSAKSNNMKIVSTEEKHEEVSPRRSSRGRGTWTSVYEDAEDSPKKEKCPEIEELKHTQCKRPASRRNKDSDNVIANAIARKEKMYDTLAGIPRKPKPAEEVEPQQPEKGVKKKSPKCSKKKSKVIKEEEVEEQESDEDSQDSSAMKLKHFCELGLKAVDPDDVEQDTADTAEDDDTIDDKEDEEFEVDGEDDEDDEDIEDGSELMEESDSDDPRDEDFLCSPKKSKAPMRRSSRRAPSNTDESERPSRSKRKRTRSPDVHEAQSEVEHEEFSNSATGDEGPEAACPEQGPTVIATCQCQDLSTIYADPAELVEPVFCQALEMMDDVLVGCSHTARKVKGVYAPLVRAGLRTPYFLACVLHAQQLAEHMCCTTCGVFCSQGIFYQCNLGHLFHLDCALPCNESKTRRGCPHCGVYVYKWKPVNKRCFKVKVEMTCSNKRIFLPTQREQCTPAYLSFSPLRPSQIEQGPVIPQELLPASPVDLKQICNRVKVQDGTEESPQHLYKAIVDGKSVEELISYIVSGRNINKPIAAESGGTCVHAAARLGHLGALYLLQYAGANLDAVDTDMRTPLKVAVTALLDKKTKEKSEIQPKEKPGKQSKEIPTTSENPDLDVMEVEMKDQKPDEKEKIPDEHESKERTKDEDLMKVIKYLVAAGCDVNLPDSDGMTPLHVAAQFGSEEVCSVILNAAGAEVDHKDGGGWTPLVWAAEFSHSNVVRLLLSAGADASSTDLDGNSAIHWCAVAGTVQPMLYLLHHAPHCVNAMNVHSDTPLHVAARLGHYSCVVVLLARGARTDIENSSGDLPVDECSGECQSAISLNMQMSLVVKEKLNRRKLLSADISRGREVFPVPCINEVDDEPLPEDFKYVTSHVMPHMLSVDCTIATMQGCDCKGGDCSSSSCGCVVLSVKKWFSSGRLHPSFPYHDPPMLFECNETCGCNAKLCTNMVLTKLCKQGSIGVRVEVFRVGGAIGWGLRSTRKVRQGTAVATYCGELLALPDADTRSPDHYLFGLDLKPDLLEQCDDKTQLCVDAAHYGSAARFINHSCKPNLTPLRVFTHSRDLRMPIIALFATRNIKPEEELTFDYSDKFWSGKSKWMKCECGSDECRYPVKCESGDP